MKSKKTRSLKLGLLIMAGLAILVVGIYLLGQKQNIFNQGVKIESVFSNVKGLQVGNKVLYSGIDVGMVSDIRIESDSVVIVEMSVDKGVMEYIHKDAIAKIKNEGVLGNKYVSLSGGTASMAQVQSGDRIRSQTSPDIGDMMSEFSVLVKDGKEAINNLKIITAKVKNGQGDLGRFINDTSIHSSFSKSAEDLEEAINNINNITAKIDSGNGDLARLINNDNLSRKINSISANADTVVEKIKVSSAEIEKASKQLNQGDGLIQMLLYDKSITTEVDTAVSRLDDGVDGVIDAAETIEQSWLFNLFNKKKDSTNQKKK